MQYVRMLTNSMLAGALVGAYVALLVLQLNPTVQLNSMAVARLVLTWLAFYGVHATAFFYGLIVLRQLLAVEVRSPGWVSLRLLAAFGTIAVSMSAVVTWLNLYGFRPVLGPDAASRLTDGAVVLTVCAAMCACLSLLQRRFQYSRGVLAAVFGLTLGVSIAGPLYFRGAGEPAPPPRTPVAPQLAPAQSSARVQMILLDGASLDFIAPNAAGGRFPNFGRLLDSGAVMHLATLRPTQPAPVWTAVATGKLPYKSSVYSAARYVVPGSAQPLDLLPDFCFAQALLRLGLIEEVERASDAVRARPIWELLSRYGVSAGVIDWPLTYPAHGVNGYLITDEFLHRDPTSVLASIGEPPLAYPPDVVELARLARLQAVPEQAAVAFASGRSSGTEAREGQGAPAVALAADAASEQIAQVFSGLRPVQFTAVRYPGIDAVGHYYLRYAVPRAFGDVSDDERLRYGRVLEQVLHLSRRHRRPRDGVARSRRFAAGRVGIRHGAAQPGQAPARAARRRSGSERQPRARARRVRHCVRPQRGEREFPPRVGRRSRAHSAVLLRPADRARSRRLCAHRHLHATLHGTAADYVHSVL